MSSELADAIESVVITGATSGIGLAAAEHFARRRVQVIGLARNIDAPAAARLRDVAAGAGAPAPLMFSVDVRDAASLADAAQEAARRSLQIRTVIAAAGINIRKSSLEVDEDSVHAMVSTNIEGAFFTFRSFAPNVLARPGGRFIAVGSVSGNFGMQLRVVYSATKSALSGMVRGLAIEWAAERATVNCIAPGIVDTPLTRGYLERNQGLEERVKEATLAGRLGTAADVVNAIEFFGRRESGFVTGQTLVIDGGFSVGNTWW